MLRSLLLTIGSTFVTTAAVSGQVLRCTSGAGDNTRIVYDFIATYAQDIAKAWHNAVIDHEIPGIPPARRGALMGDFMSMWQNRRFRVICKDESGRCRDRLQEGWAEQRDELDDPNKPRVNICYANHAERKGTRCDLVDTIVHESAHRLDVPSPAGHNDNNAPRGRDAVYRFGWAARDVCLEKARAGEFRDGALSSRQ